MQIEQAIELAIESVKKHFAGNDHRLEEVEIRDNGDVDVTVSFRGPGPSSSEAYMFGTGGIGALTSRRAAIGVDPYRTYKDVTIDSDGHVKAIRMRQIVVG